MGVQPTLNNEGSLGSTIAGKSQNPLGDRIVQVTFKLLDDASVVAWFERINTCANIAYEPSRGGTGLHMGPRLRCDLRLQGSAAKGPP